MFAFFFFSFFPCKLSFLLAKAAAFTPGSVNKSIVLKAYYQQDQ